ncbi:MAG: 16S rRNA (guanine(966)-N(2))-methyltransferase RsmD [Planctomycetota bacterium]|nr:16S rRNA (guanine(966)-N(2))-methyltransferase RsmD [Planctomycetota bacterium]
MLARSNKYNIGTFNSIYLLRRLTSKTSSEMLCPMLKIISGEYRSRILVTPKDESVTRPYPHRVRESLFNLLREWFDGAKVLDLFAGVGSMGLEAVSRGAEEVLLVERDRKIHRLLQENIDALDCGDQAQAMLGDALGPTCLARAPRPVDVIFVDPPYPMMEDEQSRSLIMKQLAMLRSVMADQGFMILRSPMGCSEVDFKVAGFEGPEERNYGKGMFVLLYSPGPMTVTG